MHKTSFAPDWFSKPGDTLAELMARQSLSPAKLAGALRRDVKVVRGVLAGVAKIDEDLATRLARCVGGTATFWKNRQQKYEAALTRVAERISNEKAAAWLERLSVDDLRLHSKRLSQADSIKACLSFFNVTNPGEWERRYTDFVGVAFRQSPSFKPKLGALAAWVRQGEIEASLVHCARWNPSLLREQLGEIRSSTRLKSPKTFVPRLKKICASVGIAIVFVRTPPGCSVSGAARFVSPDKALIIISFRHLSDDQFWFTFFHEVGHLLLHGPSNTFVDSGDDKGAKESEANNFAAGLLIPADRLDELLRLRARTEDIVRFAVSLGICPGIVVGQLQHHSIIGPRQLNFLKRRYKWEEIEKAFD
jgi:HTH-type transcriptional regulator/antitoxin HigA